MKISIYSIFLSTGMGASSDVLQKVEETAFSMCATNTEDSCDGLTWAEVELCLVRTVQIMFAH